MKAKIFITLKEGVLDPQGKAIAQSLTNLGFTGINDVRQGRLIEIEIDKDLDDRELIKTVCHEMVHVKQYAKGELRERYAPRHSLFWKSRRANGYKYDNMPWELEAWRLQEVLYGKYITACISEYIGELRNG